MFNYFRSILSSDDTRDPSWVRLIRVVLIIATLAMLGITIMEAVISQGKLAAGFYGALTLALLSGVALFFSYRNIYWPGRLLFPLSALIGVTFLAISAQGMHDSTVVGFTLVIVLASLITGRKAIPVATILTLLALLTVAMTDMMGINKSAFARTTTWEDFVVIGTIQIIAAASLNGLMTRLNSTLEKSRANEQAQIKSNQELRDLQAVLEQRVTERTHSLELAALVGRSVSQVRKLGPMLKDAAEIIRSRFDLYYVQVYLTNPTQSALLLKSGTGTVGAELIARGHSLPIDTGSVNGRSVVEKRSVVISDTTSSATFRPNPLLAETRSEMAVPLLVGEKVVGVLDLQSREAGGLSQDMLPAFEALAGQLAIAIQNASLLAETEQARAEVEAQARRLTRANWLDYLDAIHKPEQSGFVFEGNNVNPLVESDGLKMPVEGNVISAPIAVMGEALGSLVVEMDAANQNAQNVELVNVLARQVAQQIENLRLLESAERYRSDAEEASRRLTREGWKGYIEERSAKNLGYLYDLKEVKPVGQEPWFAAGDTSIALPLKVHNETIGQLLIQGLDKDDREGCELANAVVERLGAHIEGLRQYDQTQSALAQSEKLFEASRRLTQAADLQELVKATVEALNIPVVNRAVLTTLTYNAAGQLEGGTVVANWWKGTGTPGDAVGRCYSMDEVQGMSLFLGSTPLFINDVDHDERVDPASLAIAKGQNTRALADLPLYLGMRQIGTLLFESEEPHTFAQHEIRLFSALAPQIATVLENRRQYEQAQKQAERESTLNVIGQKIRSATTVDAVLQIAARELGHALGAPLTIAQLGLKDNR